MKRKIKIWLIVATTLILIGSIVFVGEMTMLKWDFKKLSTVKYETNTYEFTENINDISVITDTADIKILPSESTDTKIICNEEEKGTHLVSVTNGKLEIKYQNNKKWYENIGINYGSQKITVYIPEKEYVSLFINLSTGDVDVSENFSFESVNITASTGDIISGASASEEIIIKTSTGCIQLENLSCKTLDLKTTTGKITVSDVECSGDIKTSVSTGKTKLTNVSCVNFTTSGSTGDLNMEKVIASGNYNIKRSTGKMNFTDCDANELYIKTSTGDIKGNLLTNKIFMTESNTGKIIVPKSTKGGICEIFTDTGDIIIEIK